MFLIGASSSARRGLGLALGLLLVVATPGLAAPQGIEGTKISIEVESERGSPYPVNLWLGPDRLRVDQGTEISIVWSGGADGSMMMIMHEQQTYMEFTAEMMERMAAMMGGPPAGEEAAGEVEEMATPPRFVATGNTKTVGTWNASEYQLIHEDQTSETQMWFSEDIDVDLKSVLDQVMESMESLNNPMMQRMGGDMSDAGMIETMNERWDEMDVPAGFPVQIVTTEGGSTNTVTVTTVEQGALDSSVFQAPAGYQKMQMPFR